jgi:SAM-dependent methyltransferase
MDVRKLEVRIDRRDVRLRVGDSKGESEHVLDGAAFQRVAVVAKPLFDELSRRAGAIIGITLDPVRRRLWAAGGEGGIKLEGDDYDSRSAKLGEIARAALNEIRGQRELPPGGVSEASFWVELYRRDMDGWELGRVAPPLQRWLAQNPPRGRRVLVVGAGRGNEARFLAQLGAQVTALDFADDAVIALRAVATEVALDVRQQDLFTLKDPEFDLIVEHTCFCAIDPGRRDEYVAAVSAALRPGGELVGLFWEHGRPGGPPFSTSRAELQQRFSARFEWVLDEVPPDSVAARQGQELLVQMKKR